MSASGAKGGWILRSPAIISDPDWGCEHFDLPGHHDGTIHACRISIANVSKLAAELARRVVNTSWMSQLDDGARRTYEKTVETTAELLKEIFLSVDPDSAIKGDFGEMMVSMGSARALEMLFQHSCVPLAELWKPQRKQNGGFDFHTVCGESRINFGEAKYASSGSPYGLAISQSSAFLVEEKHLRDRSDLVYIVPPEAISNLDKDDFGIVVAFSVNAVNKDVVVANAVTAAVNFAKQHSIRQVFVVGVSHET